MAVYEIEAPNGKILEIEGDTPPTEAELDTIFAQTNTSEPKIDNVQVNEDGSLKQPLQGNVKKFDLRPSALAKEAAVRLLAHPLARYNAMKDKTYKPNYSEAVEQIKSMNERINAKYPELAKTEKRTDALLDVGSMFMLPGANVFKGAGLGARAGNAALTGGYQGGLIGGVESLRNEGDLKGAVPGAVFGAGLGGGLSAGGGAFAKFINAPKVQKGLTKTLELLTSVPAKYSQRALNAELAGKSLFKGKFDPETAYIPIERKVRQAKNMLPTNEDFASRYYQLSQKAQAGIENLKTKYNDVLDAVMKEAGEFVPDNTELLNDVSKYINRNGAAYNSFKATAPRTINFIEDNLSKNNLAYRDLHDFKHDLYDMGYTGGDDRTGTAGELARGVAGRVNNFLRQNIKGYDKPNDALSIIHDVERGVGGDTTLGKQLSKYGSEEQIKSGLAKRLKDLDNLLPAEYKVIKDTQDLIETQAEINNIKNTIAQRYERNPRLLGNRSDEGFNQVLDDLQNRTGINFMDELENIRAREALERWAPGQGGGSGSVEGFGNLIRNSILNATPVTTILTQNPLALSPFLAVSPKFMAKGTIKNLGQIYRNLDRIPPDSILKTLYGINRLNEE